MGGPLILGWKEGMMGFVSVCEREKVKGQMDNGIMDYDIIYIYIDDALDTSATSFIHYYIFTTFTCTLISFMERGRSKTISFNPKF